MVKIEKETKFVDFCILEDNLLEDDFCDYASIQTDNIICLKRNCKCHSYIIEI